MRRRSQSSIVANPVLVGAVTVLVIVVAVFLAYNANNGLPFVPTRQLDVQLANGSNLVKGNEVRSGGFRVGVVEDMEPTRLPSGAIGAVLTLKLDKAVGAIPVDSRIVIRPRSALGLKFVELTKGSSAKTLDDGATLDASKQPPPVDLDDVINTFDEPTRIGSQQALEGFGTGLAGRGGALNETIAVAPELFKNLAHVTRNLSDSRTHLAEFFKALGRTARVVAPVADVNARLFTTMADTFGAINADPQALKDTISKSPATLDVATRSLSAQRPFLQHTAAFSRDLQGATHELRAALPTLNRALSVATPVTKRSTALYKDLDGALTALRELTEAPTTAGALRGLTATVTTLQPQLRFLGPYITVCNTWNYFFTLTAEHLSSPNSSGSEERTILNGGPPTALLQTNDGVDSDSANEFIHGAEGMSTHSTYYGSAVDEQGNANCEAGQNGFTQSANPFRDRTIKGDPFKNVVVDHPFVPAGHAPSGPTYAKLNKEGKGVGLGPTKVPAGQTFTTRPGGLGKDTPLQSTYPPETTP